MTTTSKALSAAFVFILLVGLFVLNNLTFVTSGHGEVVDKLIARNIEARGGAATWASVSSLQLSGQMELGQGMSVPYVMQQKRPDKMCIEFVFDDQTATQCVHGASGWKMLPFRGQKTPEPMTEEEFSQIADSADIDGLLFNSATRGHKVELIDQQLVRGRITDKLQVTLPNGSIRWLYIDQENGLEIKLEAMRMLGGKQRIVQTFYTEWQKTNGLLIPRHLETLTEGDSKTNFLTVDDVRSNIELAESRFIMPVIVGAPSS